MTTRRIARLALSLSFLLLVAVPPVVLADDTELFTTSANPNVLLMLDITGSMQDSATGTSVGDLDGDGHSNTKMDILWKVVYTLLNADLSQPGVSINCTLKNARRASPSTTTDTNISTTRQYQWIEVNTNSATWSQFPGGATSGGTVLIGSVTVSDNMTYTSRSTGSPYRFYFSSPKNFGKVYNAGSTLISYATSSTYPNTYPTNHTEAMNADFLNNLERCRR